MRFNKAYTQTFNFEAFATCLLNINIKRLKKNWNLFIQNVINFEFLKTLKPVPSKSFYSTDNRTKNIWENVFKNMNKEKHTRSKNYWYLFLLNI